MPVATSVGATDWETGRFAAPNVRLRGPPALTAGVVSTAARRRAAVVDRMETATLVSAPAVNPSTGVANAFRRRSAAYSQQKSASPMTSITGLRPTRARTAALTAKTPGSSNIP